MTKYFHPLSLHHSMNDDFAHDLSRDYSQMEKYGRFSNFLLHRLETKAQSSEVTGPYLFCFGSWSQRAWLLLPGYSLDNSPPEQHYSTSSKQAHSCCADARFLPSSALGFYAAFPSLSHSWKASENSLGNTPAHPGMSFHHSRHKGQWCVLGISLKGESEHFSQSLPFYLLVDHLLCCCV